jgi:hypothetical protein
MVTTEQKNKLPFDVRKSYCQTVEIWGAIRNYEEFEIISESEFIEKVRSINEKYSKISESNGILP